MNGADVSMSNIVTGVPHVMDYLSRMIPPNYNTLSKIWRPLVETFQIAITAIIFATIIGLPLSFFAAKNIMPNQVVYRVTRAILGILRGIPPLLYAMLFVSMVGLGSFAGVLALTFHCIGGMGRFFSEAIENMNPGIINMGKAVGANKLKIIIHTVIPELGAIIAGYILYYFEYNVRTGTVLGLVGAGGIGLHLMSGIHLFRYGEVATIMFVIVAVITIMDSLSTMVRTRIIKGR